MKIKGADGHEYNVASQGVGGAGLGLGIAGTALGLLNGNGNGLLGGLFGGNNNCHCSDNMMVNRYELSMQQQLAAKDARIGLLESNIYTDQKIADVYERLNTKINAMKDEQTAVNTQQAVYNGVNTATLNCMQGQIAQLYTLTKLAVPQSVICPPITTTTAG